MARKEIRMEELIEVLYQWHKRSSVSQIKRSVGISRKTIRKYIELGKSYGLSRDMDVQDYQYYLDLAGKIQKGLKTPLDSSPSFKKTSLYQNIIEKLMTKKYMKAKQVYRILKRGHEYSLSYSSFNRYMNIKYPKQPGNYLRIEVRAGEEAQVDFGSAGKMYDPDSGRNRRAHAFVMTLSYSRLHYVEFVFDQGQATWVKCHMNAFKFFNGVVYRVILDNLKSGIIQPNTYDPVFNKAYAECANHYGFIIDPAKCGIARHKGKVERKIPTVRGQFLSTYDVKDISDANDQVKQWSLHEYGMEIHGTTQRKPYEVFLAEEQPVLKTLPQEEFDIPLWKEALVHPDHHIVFAKSYYSLPTRFIGKKVWVRGGLYKVHIFYDGELIKIHPRAKRPGSRVTDESDYPPEKSKYILKTQSYYQNQALEYGEYVCQLVTQLMTEHAYRNLRKIQGIFRLAEKYSPEALNLTCRRCLYYEDYRMSTIKRILEEELYLLPIEKEEVAVEGGLVQNGMSFVRSFDYFNHTKEEIQ